MRSTRYLMKHVMLSMALILFVLRGISAPISLTEPEKANLKEICKYEYLNEKLKWKDFKKTAAPRFLTFIDLLMVLDEKPEKVIETKYLSKPAHEELVYWYVYRELKANHFLDSSEVKRDENEIINECLLDTMSELVLVCNYYEQLSSQYRLLLYDKNLSKMNIVPDSFGMKTMEERAILFFFLYNIYGFDLMFLDMLIFFEPLVKMKNLPKFMGRDYYYYTGFDFPDFAIISNGVERSFKRAALSEYYRVLTRHFRELNDDEDTEDGSLKMFKNSILSKEEYFEYSNMQQELEGLFGKYYR